MRVGEQRLTERVVVIGGGGMGRCVLDLLDVVNASVGGGPRPFEVLGVLDDGRPDEDLLAARGVPFLGPVACLDRLPPDVGYLIGIGSPEVRGRIDRTLVRSGRPSPVLVHPNVHRGFDVVLGPGSIVCSHVSIENHVRVGRHVHVNQNSTVGHDAMVADHCTISPLVAVSGGVTLRDSVFVGTGAAIRQGVTLGHGSTVGMSSAVIADVAAGATVLGVPARPTPVTRR